MKNLLVLAGLLLVAYAAPAQSAPATGTGAAMDTTVFGAFCQRLAAYNAAKAARQAQPCAYASKGQAPACVDGHRDHLIPVLYGLISDSKVARMAQRGEVKLAGCLIWNDCVSYYYCSLHQKYL